MGVLHVVWFRFFVAHWAGPVLHEDRLFGVVEPERHEEREDDDHGADDGGYDGRVDLGGCFVRCETGWWSESDCWDCC
jgi:hypothetical protein